MRIWESLASLMLRPYAKVPWGMDRGVPDAEFVRYQSVFRRSLVLYMAALVIVGIAADHLPRTLQYVAALPPLALCGWFVYALIRFVAHWDELQRRIMAESGAAATVCALGLLLTYSYLEDAGFPHMSLRYVVAVFLILWAIALPLVRKHYEA